MKRKIFVVTMLGLCFGLVGCTSADNIIPVGEWGTENNFKIRVNSTKTESSIKTLTTETPSNGVYLVINMSAKNTLSNLSNSLYGSDFSFKIGDYKYDYKQTESWYYNKDKCLYLNSLWDGGEQRDFLLLFDVPTNYEEGVLTYKYGFTTLTFAIK